MNEARTKWKQESRPFRRTTVDRSNDLNEVSALLPAAQHAIWLNRARRLRMNAVLTARELQSLRGTSLFRTRLTERYTDFILMHSFCMRKARAIRIPEAPIKIKQHRYKKRGGLRPLNFKIPHNKRRVPQQVAPAV